MFRVGEWDCPLLPPSLLPRRLEPGMWELLPVREGERFFGLALQNEGKRTLVSTADGASWAPIALPGIGAPPTDYADLGEGELASATAHAGDSFAAAGGALVGARVARRQVDREAGVVGLEERHRRRG